MTNKEAYEAKFAEATAIPAEKTRYPYIPVDEYTDECEELFYTATQDKQALLKAGLQETMISNLEILTDALREAQSIWNRDRDLKKENAKEWAEKSEQGFNLRNEMLRACKYAYRHNNDILRRVAAIAEGEDTADMIQDLNDLSVLARTYPEPILGVGCTNEKIELSSTLSGELAALRYIANGEREESNENKIIRDQMYTLLKEVNDEVRECGKFVFWNNPEKLKKYSSRYNRKHRGNGSNDENPITE
ncbi:MULTISPECIES: hypothetical protein [unclassified Saccharicrinis]|uniref:hypothetical protein n=1 Tax=unclassified Saccharicrinis TaxID=2646859 RepID=UPI003D33817C